MYSDENFRSGWNRYVSRKPIGSDGAETPTRIRAMYPDEYTPPKLSEKDWFSRNVDCIGLEALLWLAIVFIAGTSLGWMMHAEVTTPQVQTITRSK